jgi:threonine aldolase
MLALMRDLPSAALPPIEIDLSSDTQTRPSAAMRRFMAEAEVGDEQYHEDPTVSRLEGMVAALLGKEAAVFLPSGTMCNEIALRVHCRPGEEVLIHPTAHPIHFEGGGPAAMAGVMVRAVDGPRGHYDAMTLEAAIRPAFRHSPRSRLVWVEQTSNLGGGSIWPLERVRAVTEVARGHGLSAHLDGARLMNAVVATGVAAGAWAAPFDSAWIDFSKGLGAPVGAVLAGSGAFIEEAWRLKQQMGGAMRQAGIIAAGGIYALEHNVARLADDHANARRLATGLAELPGITLDPSTVETNIVIFELSGALDGAGFTARMRAQGVRMTALEPRRARAVTHLDIDAEQIERTVAIAAEVLRA